MAVRVRFAPSPTGDLHLGGLRTALYNYLLSRSPIAGGSGKFILRIEDTDQARFVPHSMDSIISHLRWANLSFDEGPGSHSAFGPFVQSQRLHLYQKYAQYLISTNQAYKCFCPAPIPGSSSSLQQYPGTCRNLSSNELNSHSGDRFVVRFNSSHFNLPASFYDHTFKHVNVNQAVDDFILLKSDGWPTYHLASVVDDHLMEISHVLRGHEWLPSTSKHILLYQAFKWEPPTWVHLPLLLNQDRKKLSKREEGIDFTVSRFRDHGYLPEVLLNFVSILGWTPHVLKKEILSLPEMQDQFNLDKLHVSPAIVDLSHLDWLQKTHFSSLVSQKSTSLLDQLRQMLSTLSKDIPSILLTDKYLNAVLALISTRLHRIPDIVDKSKYFWLDPETDPNLVSDTEFYRTVARVTLNEWYRWPCSQVEIDQSISRIVEQCIGNNKRNIVMKALRFLVTGTHVGASLGSTILLLGRDVVERRLRKFL